MATKLQTQRRVLGRVIATMQKESSGADSAVKTDIDEQIEVLRDIYLALGMLAQMKETMAWLIESS